MTANQSPNTYQARGVNRKKSIMTGNFYFSSGDREEGTPA
jgi:hypothetical protein